MNSRQGRDGRLDRPVVLVLGGRSELGRQMMPRLVDEGYQLIATSRSAERSDQQGIDWLQADPVNGRPAFGSDLQDWLAGRSLGGVINLLGSWMRGEPEKVLVDTSQWLSTSLRAWAPAKTGVLYISGTAVYGDRPGESLTEDSPVHPQSQMGK